MGTAGLLGKDLAATEVFAWGATLVHGERTTGEDNAVDLIFTLPYD